MDNASLKKKIYSRRKELGYTQEMIAENISVSLNSYIKIEKGPTKLIHQKLEKIAQLLDISMEELLLGPCITANEHEQMMNELSDTFKNEINAIKDESKRKDIFIERLNQLLDIKEHEILVLKSQLLNK